MIRSGRKEASVVLATFDWGKFVASARPWTSIPCLLVLNAPGFSCPEAP
jgi:hypothetical protein